MGQTILLVEDDPMQAELAQAMLKRLGYAARVAGNGASALKVLQEGAAIDLALLDIGLPGMDGLELLELIKQRHPLLPCIILTGAQDVETAVKAMQLGAADFMGKPMQLDRMRVALANALKTALLEREVKRLVAKAEGHFTFENLVGADMGLADVVRLGRKAAASDIPVLLNGETGTGKEVFARAIHGESHRAGKPFVAVNCGAIPLNLAESILFGHEKGAFTGAIARSIGKFREAEGGTIFLDEIGDLPLETQVKLLRVLQQKEITAVGADHAVPVNVRVISATNRKLEDDVAQGRFREDLYYRLNVLQILIPALRERAGDIPELARYFLESFAVREDRAVKNLAPQTVDMLSKRTWVGNVRELENAIHRAMVMAEGDTLLPSDFTAAQQGKQEMPVSGVAGAPRPLAELEREAIENALAYFGGNVTAAAKALGLAKSTFYRKLKELELL
ncbi:MAG: sigma-54 dependent transcriptional regulator [Alphaproteobacteria bacterium]|nr:sigma-54 dependent transcriptional regulator [Alphaproteobacteria bacterium]